MERSILKLPLSKICGVPSRLQNRALFEGGNRAKRCPEKERKRGGQQRGQKGKKDAWKQVSWGLLVIGMGLSETWEPPQFWKKTLSEWKGRSRSNSRNSGAFSEQLSEWLSRPNLCENPILGATLGATLGIGWTPKFQPKFSERFFQNWGGPRAPESCRPQIFETTFTETFWGMMRWNDYQNTWMAAEMHYQNSCQSFLWRASLFYVFQEQGFKEMLAISNLVLQVCMSFLRCLKQKWHICYTRAVPEVQGDANLKNLGVKTVVDLGGKFSENFPRKKRLNICHRKLYHIFHCKKEICHLQLTLVASSPKHLCFCLVRIDM